MERLTRTSYVDENGADRDEVVACREAQLDLTAYQRPLERAHGAALHTPGVARGLHVRAVQGAAGLRVLPGIALSGTGDHIVLAPDGRARLDNKILDVKADGTAVSTTRPDGRYTLTIAWAETFRKASGQELFFADHTPQLTLRPVTDTVPDTEVVLADLTIATGTVTALDPGDRRQCADAVRLHRPSRTVVDSQLGVEPGPAAALLVRSDGSLEVDASALTVPAALAVGGVALRASAPGAPTALSIDAARLTLGGRDDTLTVDAATGNVGIGTATPTARLEVAGTLAADGLSIRGSAGTPALSIDGMGNIGIGTASPKARLDIAGSLAVDGRRALSTGDGFLRLNQENELPKGVHTPRALSAGSLNVGGVGSWADPGDGRLAVRAAIRIGAAVQADAAAAIVVDDDTPNNTWNTAAFRRSALGKLWSHIHYGATGDWYIRSAHETGKVVLQDQGGDVGIGTGRPRARLEVSGAVMPATGAGTDAGVYFRPDWDGESAFVRYVPTRFDTSKLTIGVENSGDAIVFARAGTEQMSIRNDEVFVPGLLSVTELAVNTVDVNTLRVSGQANLDEVDADTVRAVTIEYQNLSQVSSARVKEHITLLDDARLRELHDDAVRTPVATFAYRGAAEPARRHLGVILESCPPYLTHGNGIDPVGYTAMLHGAVKVLANRVAELTAQLARPRTDGGVQR